MDQFEARLSIENIQMFKPHGHAWRHVLGDAGALGAPFDDLLYRAQPNEPALIQGEVGVSTRNGR
jgi:hypothetical protein